MPLEQGCLYKIRSQVVTRLSELLDQSVCDILPFSGALTRSQYERAQMEPHVQVLVSTRHVRNVEWAQTGQQDIVVGFGVFVLAGIQASDNEVQGIELQVVDQILGQLPLVHFQNEYWEQPPTGIKADNPYWGVLDASAGVGTWIITWESKFRISRQIYAPGDVFTPYVSPTPQITVLEQDVVTEMTLPQASTRSLPND